MTGCFHSLQTGKGIPSHNLPKFKRQDPILVSIPFKREKAFQVGQIWLNPTTAESFHSLQTGKCIPSNPRQIGGVLMDSFHSLQTGKCIPRPTPPVHLASGQYHCFHSLQTGKCIPRLIVAKTHAELPTVSIPFKRESLSQVHKARTIRSKLIKFPFPSNGKAYRKPRD